MPGNFLNLRINTNEVTTIIIDENTRRGRIILELVRELNAGHVLNELDEESPVYNQKTIKAIQKATEGETIVCEDFNDYLRKVK
ncbi:MAG TPA: hypothetical protein P5086_13460 [Prolixibacteraceae bacterium]|nr:hypothetical protein [Prolixibacteraceae bacterium]